MSIPNRFLLALSFVIALARPSIADAQNTAFITSPACGGNLSAGATINWSSVPGATAYYLYVGSRQGLNDLVNTGEIQARSYTPGPLPAGLVYARIWAKTAGIWRSSDCTYTSTSSGPASFTAPANGAQVSSNPVNFTWTSVAGAQAYYLYVGTTVGAKDVVDTGELPQTAYSAALPAGRHLFARIWTKFSGRWVFQDIDFTTSAAAPATLIDPADGVTANTGNVTFRWTVSSGAISYYLYVGSGVGLKDIVDTGEVSTTGLTASLPEGRQMFARLWTRFSDRWEYRDTRFRTGSVVSWTWPRDGASVIASPVALTWTPVQGATYDVTIGTTAGGSNVLRQQGLTTAVLPNMTLPSRRTLFARVVAHVNGQDHASATQFTTAGSIASAWSTFLYPFDGASGVAPSTKIAWTPVDGAISYYLYIGRKPGAKDVLDYGEVQATSVDMSSLPSGPLFARIWTRFSYGWKYSDIVFTTADAPVTPVIAYPAAGATQPIDLAYPLQWMPVPGVHTYRLQIGTAAGRADLLDTGSIAVTRRYVPGLPTGKPLYGRISAQVLGVWKWTDFQFVASGTGSDISPRLSAALALTREVRAMANSFNQADDGSKLAEVMAAAGVTTAFCTQYADTLIELIKEADLRLSATRQNICLNPTNAFDCHTLVAAVEPVTHVRLLLDPTMGFAPVHQSTGGFLVAEEMGAADAAQSFGDVAFQFVSPQSDAWAASYYIDYPLLYFNLAAGHSPLEVMDLVGTSVSGPTDLYAVQCVSGSTTAVVDGQQRTLTCAGTERLTQVFVAGSIQPSAGASIKIWRPKRFIFK